MTERQPKERFAIAAPIEVAHKRDGDEIFLGAVGTDEEILEGLRRKIEQQVGVPVERVGGDKKGHTFFFAANDWNSSWKPSGEKRPRIIVPKDPGAN